MVVFEEDHCQHSNQDCQNQRYDRRNTVRFITHIDSSLLQRFLLFGNTLLLHKAADQLAKAFTK